MLEKVLNIKKEGKIRIIWQITNSYLIFFTCKFLGSLRLQTKTVKSLNIYIYRTIVFKDPLQPTVFSRSLLVIEINETCAQHYL